MILQLPYSDINKKSWIFLLPFLPQKQKLCHQNSHSSSDCLFVDRATRRSLGVLAESHDFFVLLKRNGPSLRTLAEPEAEVKVVKLCFKEKKKRFYPNKSHFCRSVCFPVSWYKLQESTGTAGLQHKEVKPKDPATNLDDGKLKFQAPAAAPAASPGAGETKPQAPAATSATLVPRKTQPEPQEKPGTPGEARGSRSTSCQPGAQQKCSWGPQEAVAASLGPTRIKNFWTFSLKRWTLQSMIGWH